MIVSTVQVYGTNYFNTTARGWLKHYKSDGSCRTKIALHEVARSTVVVDRALTVGVTLWCAWKNEIDTSRSVVKFSGAWSNIGPIQWQTRGGYGVNKKEAMDVMAI
jgi:hypothetical protein